MSVFLRTLPGLVSLLLVGLSGFVATGRLAPFVEGGNSHPSFFTTSFIISIVLSVSAPLAFFFIGKATRCRPDWLKIGTVVIALGVLPLLAGVVLLLVDSTTPPNNGANIGAGVLTLLGLAVSLLGSLVLAVALPMSGPASTRRVDDRRPLNRGGSTKFL